MSQFYMRNANEEPQKGDMAGVIVITYSKEQYCYIRYYKDVELLDRLKVADSDDIFWLVKGYEEDDKIQIVMQEDLVNVGYYGD